MFVIVERNAVLSFYRYIMCLMVRVSSGFMMFVCVKNIETF